jgi:HK97 family phage portal protein
VSYSATGRFNLPSFTGHSNNETYMRTMGTAGTVFQIVSLLSTATASPQWRLYRKPKGDGRVRYTTGDRGSDQRTEVLQHQALNVWNRPNSFNTGNQFRESGWQHQELTGEQWWVVTRDARASFPTGLWLVRPDRMEPIPSAEKFIAGYVYTGPTGERVPLGVDEVILTKYPNPMDPYRGLGPVQSILVDIDAMRYSAEWNRNFFMNSAVPGGIVTVPNNLSDEEFDQFTTRWRESHQGVSRSHRVAVLEGGAQWQNTQMSLRDMDFSNLREVSRDVLREAWGIHKSMLGNAEDVNRANAETAEEVFGRWKVLPRLNRQRDVLNNTFLPMFGSAGEGVEFDYDNPLNGDRESDNAELAAKTTAYATLVQAGVDPDSAAEVVGLPPMKRAEIAPPPTRPALPPGTGGVPDAEPPTADDTQPGNRAERERITMTAVRNAGDKPIADPQLPNTPPDLSEVDQAWQQATDQVVAAYTAQVTPDQQQQATDQIRDAVEAAALVLLAALLIDTSKAKALLLAAMVEFSASSAHRASREAAAQGADSVMPVSPPHEVLSTIAEVTADLMGKELAVSAGREALRVAATGADGQAVADEVQTFLSTLSEAPIRTHLSGAISAAQNLARYATFTQPGAARCQLISTEVLDSATCIYCIEINGTVFGYSDDPAAVAASLAAYPVGGYINCLGREKCRGTLIAQYETPAEPQASDTSVLSMLLRLEALLRSPDSAHINGHELHEHEVSA